LPQQETEVFGQVKGLYGRRRCLGGVREFGKCHKLGRIIQKRY